MAEALWRHQGIMMTRLERRSDICRAKCFVVAATSEA